MALLFIPSYRAISANIPWHQGCNKGRDSAAPQDVEEKWGNRGNLRQNERTYSSRFERSKGGIFAKSVTAVRGELNSDLVN